jgi:hypothetical protein
MPGSRGRAGQLVPPPSGQPGPGPASAGAAPGPAPCPGPRRNARPSSMYCTLRGSLTWPPARCGRSCWTRASTWAPIHLLPAAAPGRRDPRAPPPGHPPRGRETRTAGHRAEPGLILGHHQTARAGEMGLLLPLRHPRHLLPLRRRLDAHHLRRPGSSFSADGGQAGGLLLAQALRATGLDAALEREPKPVVTPVRTWGNSSSSPRYS